MYFKLITRGDIAEVDGLVDDINACNIYNLTLTPIFDLISSEHIIKVKNECMYMHDWDTICAPEIDTF